MSSPGQSPSIAAFHLRCPRQSLHLDPPRHAPIRRPHGSMAFRSFAAVNGLRPPRAARHRASGDARLSTGYARAIDGGKTSEKRGLHAVDGALCPTGAGRGLLRPKGARLYRRRVRGDPSSGVSRHPRVFARGQARLPQGEKGGARRPLICRLRRHLLPAGGEKRTRVTPSSAAARYGCARGRRRRRAACGIRRASRGSRRSPAPSARRYRPASPRKAAGSLRSFPAPRR